MSCGTPPVVNRPHTLHSNPEHREVREETPLLGILTSTHSTFARNFLVARSIPGGKCSQSVPKMDTLKKEHNFINGSRLLCLRPNANRFTFRRKSLCVSASWVANTQTAGELFTFGTVAVLPFYALMVLAPKSNLTKRTMDCHIPYVLLGALYSFLLYLSWTPDKMQLLFASKYLLPELSSISQMFTNDIALASAWIHLLAVDLFAARQVFHDGQKHNIETRHSITLCLFFCPIGIMTHAFTRALTKRNSGEE